MRIVGLASGMDIDALVKDLMKAERIPLDKMVQQKQMFEWQRDSYREINKLLDELDRLIFDGVYRLSNFRQKKVTSSDESAVVAKAINASANTSTAIEVQQLAKAATYSAATLNNFTSGARTLKFEVTDPGSTETREVTINIGENDTLDDVIYKINSSNLGVTGMKLKDSSGVERLVLTNNKTGEGGTIKAADSETFDFLQSLGFSLDDTTFNLIPETAGQNAKVKINGYETVQTSNTFTIAGIEYTIKNVTTSPVTISTSTDVDAILDTIVKFVNKYNEVIEKINGKLTEERFRNFPPLTDEQKEEMTEKQIELWEEKAKSGLLRGDAILTSGLNQMRLDLYSPVAGDALKGFKQLTDIGISTTANYLDRGKLTIDENKLREKIQENPEAIYKLFMSDGESYNDKGIARRLRDSLKGMMTKIKDKAGTSLSTNDQFTIGKNLKDLDNRINAFQDRLIQIESRYYRQFTAMEQAIQRANQQSAYLMQLFGGGA